MRHGEADGTHWDTEKLREAREFGWFRQHEAEMIEAARRKRAEAEANRRAAVAAQFLRPPHWKECPGCGGEMAPKSVEGVDVLECRTCEGFFFERGELELMLLRHDEHRRGFFRGLLGFGKT